MGEERVRRRMGNNRGKKNRQLMSGDRVISDGGGGGNGIAGLVVFGGALSVASFIAVVIRSLAINKNNSTKCPVTDPNPKPKPEQPSLDNNGCNSKSQDGTTHQIEAIHGQGLGLAALLQPSTTPTNDNGDAACHGTTDMKSIDHTCIPEEKIDPLSVSVSVPVPDLNNISEVVSPNEEIVLSDDSHPENAVLVNSNDFQAQDVEPQESLQSVETETQDDDVIVSEQDSLSKAILNFNEKPDLWPAQEEDFSFKGEGGKIDIQNEAQGEAKTETDDTANGDVNVTSEEETFSNGKGGFSVVPNDQPSASHSFQLTTWLMPVGLLALLLLLSTYVYPSCTTNFYFQ